MTDTATVFPQGLPKYQAIAQHYEQAIANGEFQVGDRLPSERKLASQWEITPMTVRQALEVLRGKQLIVRRQGDGTFVSAPPRQVAAPARQPGATYVLGLTTATAAASRHVNWQPRLRRFQGLVDAAFRHGIVLDSNLTLDLDVPPQRLVETLSQAAGLVLQEELLPESVLAGLAEMGIPMVAINCYTRTDYCSRLLVDSRRGALAAVRHLADRGHTRIGLIVGDPNRFSHGLRKAGYEDAHDLLGLPIREEYILVEPRGLEEDGVAACRHLLELPEPPTAVFVASDRRALGILEAADELGISIPQDLSLIGFDDLAEAATAQPPLTTLHNPLYESGERAIEMLIQQLNGETAPGTLTMLPAPLMVRESTADFCF